MNNYVEQQIADYLKRLKQALHDQDPALIQDAQYDAEEHLRAALEDRTQAQKAFIDICTEYGSPEEIAEYYRNMEANVTMALHGPKKSSRSKLSVGFFAVIRDTRAYTALLYLLLVLPLAIVYFAWVMMAGISSLALSLLIVGIPLLVVFLSSMSFFAFLEGRLIEMLLGQRMPRRPHYRRSITGWKPWAAHTLKNKRHWRAALYLLLQMPLGLIYFAIIAIPFLFSIVIFISPVVDPLLHWIDPIRYSIDIHWYWFPLAMPAGALGFVLTLLLAKTIGRFQAWLARHLLISMPNDD